MNFKAPAQVSLKRLALTRANAQMLGVAMAAAFLTVLSLSAAHYFMGLRSYQANVIAADQTADSRLKKDVTAKNQLVNSYETFVSQNPNLLGKANQTGPYVYNNATIILDALPSQYDFPALTSTLDSMLTNDGYDITNISGTDETGQVSNSPSPNPSTVTIPFSFTLDDATYQSIQSLFAQMQQSIRPLQIDNFSLSGSDTNMTLTLNAHTYFQPGKSFNIGTETIKK